MENYRDENVDNEQPELFEDGEGEGDEQEPDFDDAQRAYVERQVQAAREAERAAVRTSLQSQGMDWTGDGAAIRDVNTFAAKFGFVGQQQEQPAANPAAPDDPYAALGERPDPNYYADEARAWDQKYRAALKAEAMAELQPQIQQVQGMLAQTQVDAATARAQQLLRDLGHSSIADHPDFPAEFGETLLKNQPMNTWHQPEVLTGIAGWVIPKLKPVERREQPRGQDGRYEQQDANQRSLRQVASPRESGRPAANSAAGMDATTRAMAQAMGITPERWAHLKEIETEEQHREWESRRLRSGRR